jgi:protein-S-isoprenylcysteine O-methyltransferase Ste14
MSLTRKAILLSSATVVLLFLGLAFAHQYEHHDHGTNCAVCHWVSNLGFILPVVSLFILFLQKTNFALSDFHLTPQLSSPANSSRSPPF